MDSKPSLFPFRWALPVVQLLACALVLWPVRHELVADLERRPRPQSDLSSPRIVIELRAPASPARNASPQPSPQPSPRLTIQPSEEASSKEGGHEEHILEARLSLPPDLNFPATLFGFPFAGLFFKQPMTVEYYRAWRDLVIPVLGIIFWWAAGRGLEALINAKRKLISPRIGPPETTLAIAIFIFAAPISLMWLYDAHFRAEFDSRFLAAGAGLWTVLTAITLTARIAQWRIRRTLAAAKN